jgi:ATP-dependent protease HslVU (ClpYQ) peptidase subunit
MASRITESAKQQTWSRDERSRELSFVREAISMLTGVRDLIDRKGKLLKLGSGGNKKMPLTATRLLRDNGVTMIFHAAEPEPEGLRVLRELNAALAEGPK